MSNPFDEPTTLQREDLPRQEFIPRRHADTDLRPMRGFLIGAVAGTLVSALLVVVFYYWLAP